ncbi:hypothetical protein M422DRAFT_238942 [Sphaerobolus stellatus SS14]|nr:hypothetical protein M422DRAFT_238942 [Sphaerobolus stellatus SS14]
MSHYSLAYSIPKRNRSSTIALYYARGLWPSTRNACGAGYNHFYVFISRLLGVVEPVHSFIIVDSGRFIAISLSEVSRLLERRQLDLIYSLKIEVIWCCGDKYCEQCLPHVKDITVTEGIPLQDIASSYGFGVTIHGNAVIPIISAPDHSAVRSSLMIGLKDSVLRGTAARKNVETTGDHTFSISSRRFALPADPSSNKVTSHYDAATLHEMAECGEMELDDSALSRWKYTGPMSTLVALHVTLSRIHVLWGVRQRYREVLERRPLTDMISRRLDNEDNTSMRSSQTIINRSSGQRVRT